MAETVGCNGELVPPSWSQDSKQIGILDELHRSDASHQLPAVSCSSVGVTTTFVAVEAGDTTELSMVIVFLFTERSRGVVHQFSTVGRSHRATHRHRKDELLCKSGDRMHHDDDVCVFSRCFPGVLLSI